MLLINANLRRVVNGNAKEKRLLHSPNTFKAGITKRGSQPTEFYKHSAAYLRQGDPCIRQKQASK
jgi:hypothetical protein